MVQSYRDKCLREKGEECDICGQNGSVVVHHIDGNRSNNDLDNLIPLCYEHHAKAHAGSDDVPSYLVERLEENGHIDDENHVLTVRVPDWIVEHYDQMADEKGVSRAVLLRQFLADNAGGESAFVDSTPVVKGSANTKFLKEQIRTKDEQIDRLLDIFVES